MVVHDTLKRASGSLSVVDTVNGISLQVEITFQGQVDFVPSCERISIFAHPHFLPVKNELGSFEGISTMTSQYEKSYP